MARNLKMVDFLFGFVCVFWAISSDGKDWPTYRHDISRSGVTQERLRAEALAEQWTWQSTLRPQPAWAGPARWDAYHDIKRLRSMREYDAVFHPIVSGRSVYFASSSDDSVRCLEMSTGEENWIYTAGGPLRMAPTFWKGRIYVGADDGYATCLQAGNGEEIWRFRPSEAEHKVVSNGKALSLSPCRTGVLVDGGVAVFAMGMLPWKASFLCAVDAKTGTAEGEGLFVRSFPGLTFEGAMAASKDMIVCPQGRVAPWFFERDTGRKLGQPEKGGGGCFVLLSEEEEIYHGPGNKGGWITATNGKKRAQIATYPAGVAMVVAGGNAFVLEADSLVALSRENKSILWRTPSEEGHELIKAGNVLFVGGDGEVRAYDVEKGDLVWRHSVRGKAFGLAVGAGSLLVSTDEGVLYCFREGVEPKDVDLSGASPALTSEESETRSREDASRVAVGPFLRFTGEKEATVRWITRKPCASCLTYGFPGQKATRIRDESPTREHELVMKDLLYDRVYEYQIHWQENGERMSSQVFECHTFMNFSVSNLPQDIAPFLEEGPSLGDAASKLLSATGVRQGLCLILGSNTGRLAYELALRSDLRIIGFDEDVSAVSRARTSLLQRKAYGGRVTLHSVPSLKKIPLVGDCASLIVSERVFLGEDVSVYEKEAMRLVEPGSGVAFLNAEGPARRKEMPEGAGEWTHLYGRPDNCGFGGERLSGAQRTEDLEVLWVGRPGPRFHADRNGRKPCHLAIDGRLYLQGLERIIALEAHNGTVLWSLEIPGLVRCNVPRDSSNWCCDHECLYAAVRDRCWKICGDTGEVDAYFSVTPAKRKKIPYEWGYIARSENLLLGTSVKEGTIFCDFWGNPGWYDASGGEAAAKVCSDALFALSADDGKPVWIYEQGVIVNPTITLQGGNVFFVACRNEAVKQGESRRLFGEAFWTDQFLVCLDLSTGVLAWEKPLDTVDGDTVFYMACGGRPDPKLIILSSADKRYHVYAFDPSDGEPQWNHSFEWGGGDHGKHMSRPAILRDLLFVRPQVLRLATGEVLDKKMPMGGCGTYASTENAFFFRNGNVSMWDVESGSFTSWARLRPDCWLSTIPALGLLLSPEGGGGCSCGAWMETSVVFRPKKPVQELDVR